MSGPGYVVPGRIGWFVAFENGRLSMYAMPTTVSGAHGPLQRHAFDAALLADEVENLVLSQAPPSEPLQDPTGQTGTTVSIAFVDRESFNVTRSLMRAAAQRDRATQQALRAVERPGAVPQPPSSIVRVNRLLEFRAGQPTSGYLPVLSDALSEKYYAPTGVDQTSAAAWCTAFGLAPGPQSWIELARLATLGHVAARDLAKSVFLSERSGLGSATGASLRASIGAFVRAETILAAWEGLIALDRTLLERNALTSVAARVRVVATKDATFRAVVRGSVKLKEGASIVILNETITGDQADTKVASISFDESSEQLVIECTGKAAAEFAEKARAAGDPLWIAEQPFAMVRASIECDRWTSVTKPGASGLRAGEQTDVASTGPGTDPGSDSGPEIDDGTDGGRLRRARDVPMDVIVAGVR